MAQLVKNLPAMQETWVQSLGWDDLLEKGKVTHSSILAESLCKGKCSLTLSRKLEVTHLQISGVLFMYNVMFS